MRANRLYERRINSDTRFGQGWIRTSEDVGPADFLYASIQSEAISRWAVFQIQFAGTYELVELPPQACLSQSAGVLDSFSKEAIRRLAYGHLTNEEKKILQNDFIAWTRGKDRRSHESRPRCPPLANRTRGQIARRLRYSVAQHRR